MNNALIQGTKEWKELRRNKVGGSDAPVIMEVSPWTTPYQLWQQKILGTEKKQTAVMQRGLDLEQKARDRFSDITGLLVAPSVDFHPDHPWMMASLDAKDIEGKHIAEIKCPGKHDHDMAVQGLVPEKYYPQLQHQMVVCQLDKAFYFSFDGENGILLEVYRDQKYIIKLIEKEKAFWEGMQNLVPPELTIRDYQTKDDDVWSMYASQWITMNSQLKELEKKEKALREQLISMSQDQNTLGSGIKVSKVLRKGTIDYSKIPELKNVNLETYRKETVEYWKIAEA